jgi:hypothetical protein
MLNMGTFNMINMGGITRNMMALEEVMSSHCWAGNPNRLKIELGLS